MLFILKRAPTADRAILVITFALTVFADLVVAVNVGVILAILQFLRRMASAVQTQPVNPSALSGELARLGFSGLPPTLMVYEIDGPMFFGAVQNFERALLQTHTDPLTLIIRLGGVPFMDITGIQTLQEVVDELRKRGVRVVLCEANTRVLRKLRNAGIMDGVGDHGQTLAAALLQAGLVPTPAQDRN